MKHELKTDPIPFQEVKRGQKTTQILPGKFRNEPSHEGETVGRFISKLAEDAAPIYRASFAKDGKPVPQRCSTCAFRLGSLPNRCLATTADALKCATEMTSDFLCHDKAAETPDGQQVCVGWAMVITKEIEEGRTGIECPWPFSDEIEPEKPVDEHEPKRQSACATSDGGRD